MNGFILQTVHDSEFIEFLSMTNDSFITPLILMNIDKKI